MSTTSNRVLRMSFLNQAGKTVSITLPFPRVGLAPSEVIAAMDLAVSRGIFTSSGGDLLSVRDIKIVDSTTEDMFTPPSV